MPPTKHGHLRCGEREQIRLVDQQLLGGQLLAGPHVVAEPVGPRLEHVERLGVGHLLGGVGAARRERHGDVVPGVLRRLLDGRAPG